MTPTPNPTAGMATEAIVAKALRDSWSDELEYTDAPEAITAALRDAGLLSEGAPSEEPRGINLFRDLGFDETDPNVVKARADAAFEEQIERAARAINALDWTQTEFGEVPHERDIARAALTAAGVAPQEPQALDPEKVAEVLNRHEPIFKDGQYAGRCVCGFKHPSYSGWRLHRARALCEAHTEGKLT